MSSIPYYLGSDLSAVLHFPGQFYRKCFNALIQANGLGVLIGSLAAEEKSKGVKRKPFSWEAVAVVLRHVIYRTLVFEKPMEFIRVLDIAKGKPTIGIGGCGLGERTVAGTLAYLAPPKGDYLIKINLAPKVAITPLYGINLPGFLQLIKVWWEASVIAEQELKDPAGKCDCEVKFKSRLAKYGFGLVEDCAEFLELYKPTFEFLQCRGIVKDFGEFLRELKEQLPARRVLMDGMDCIDNKRRW